MRAAFKGLLRAYLMLPSLHDPGGAQRMPAETLDRGGNADTLVFKELIKKSDISRLEQTGSMIIF
ncbi:MAG: hypothetical protein ACREDG_06540, partial [Methylocella sp.]